MRYVHVTADGIREYPEGAVATGDDYYTGDVVRFSMSLDDAAAVQAYAVTTVPVADEDLIEVVSGPVRGDWDSPGTSEES
jgi:hypothetical protein